MQEKEYHWGEQEEDGLIHYHYDVPISTIAQRSGGDPSTVYLQVWDWPLNKGTVKVDLKAARRPGSGRGVLVGGGIATRMVLTRRARPW